MDIRQIIDAFGSAGKAAQATAGWLSPIKRQTLESWYEAGRFPTWRKEQVTRLKALAEQSTPKRRKASQ